MRVILIERGGVVGQQYIGPVDLDSLDKEGADRIRSALEAVDFETEAPEPGNVPMRTLNVEDGGDERSVSWRGPTTWGAEISEALEAVAEWKVGSPPDLG